MRLGADIVKISKEDTDTQNAILKSKNRRAEINKLERAAKVAADATETKNAEPLSETDTAEPNWTPLATSETKTDSAEHPSAHDSLRDACKAVLAEGGASDVLDIIRECDLLAIIMAEVEVPDLLTEMEARGQEAAEEGLLRLVRKWADTSGMEVIVKPKRPATTAGDSAPDAVAEAAAPDAVAEPYPPEIDDDSGVDADTDVPDDEDANRPEPHTDGSPTGNPQDEPAEAELGTEPLDPATSTDCSDASPATTVGEPPTFENTDEAAAWAMEHLGLELEPKHPLYLLRTKIDRAVAERKREAGTSVDNADVTNPQSEARDPRTEPIR